MACALPNHVGWATSLRTSPALWCQLRRRQRQLYRMQDGMTGAIVAPRQPGRYAGNWCASDPLRARRCRSAHLYRLSHLITSSPRRTQAVLEQRMRAYSVLVLASMHGPLAGHISLPGLPLPDELVHASRHLDDEEALERAAAVERSGMLALEQSYADDGGRTGPSGGLMSQREIAEQMDAPESACGEHSVPPEPPAEDERAQLPTGWMRPEQVTVQLPVGRDRPLKTTLPSGQPALATWGDTLTPSVAAPPGAEAGSGVEPMQSWRHGAGPGGVATAHRSPAPLAVLAEPSRSRVSSPVLLGTMLEQEELQLLRSLVKRFGGRVVGKTWSPEVTHVVSATKCGANGTAADERLCGRTIKFCGAVLSGQWIVGASWIRESAKHGFWVAEEAHEVHGDNSTISNGRGAGGPRRGRLRRERDEPRLFDGLCVYLHGSFVRPTRRELAQLVEYGGGVVVDRLPEVGIVHRARVAPPHRILVVCAELPADQSLRSRCAEAGLPAPVDHEWLFDSISKHKCMPWPEVDALHASDATPSQLSEVF